MRVLFVSFYYPPEVGAAPTRVANMAEGLRCRGAEIDVLTCLPNYPQGRIFNGYKGRFSMREERNGISTFRYWTYATVSRNAVKRGASMMSFAVTMWSFAWHRRRIKSYDYVIVQCPPLPVAVSTMLMFKKLFGKKVLVNISDLWPLSAVELGAMKKDTKIYRAFAWMERFVYRNASGVLGQSQEIIDHVSTFKSPFPKFLYRNVKRIDSNVMPHIKNNPLKIVYAGLLGVAQDIASIIKSIDFKSIGAEFHIYGGGHQAKEITQYIETHPERNIFYHGYVSKEQLSGELAKFDASIVPLAARIHGAVPSKIFDLLPVGLPVLFCGEGEGALIVERYGVGFTSASADYSALRQNIEALCAMTDDDYSRMAERCIQAAKHDFNLDVQLTETYNFIKTI